MRSQLRVVCAAAAASLMLAACGSRLTPEQQQLAIRAGNGGGGSGSGVSDQSVSTGTSGTNAGSPVPGSASGAGTTGGSHAQSGGSTGSAGGSTIGGATAPGASSCRATKATDVGITPTSITLANIADVTGPVPGLFQSAQQSALAFSAYWNATHGGICGRQIKVETLDSRTDANGYRDQMLTACKSAFASVGSMSAFDNGGAQVEDQCGIPDISAAAVTPEHQASKVTFAANSTQVGQVSSTVPGWIAEKYPQAVGKAAFLYINAGAAAVNAQADVKTYEQYGHGWKFVYTQPVDISTFNYAPFVQKMKQNGVRFVQWLGAYQEAVRLAQAMQQQGFKPDIFLLDPTGYSSDYVQSGGSAVDGTVVYLDSALFQDAGSNQEMATYITWLHRVAGSDAQPSYFGIYAWSAMLLFAQTAEKIGPDLTRAKLLAALKQVDNWTGNGLHSPQHVGPRQTPNCFAFIQLHGSSWSRLHPTTPTFDCRPDIGG
ncbi:MAG TPA: ABC transporter substrate-binding protein [Mycobacteriales bacterium]|nr:ABC transporter substrate-binding protein [Mycobacteriales bacterium]